MITPFELLAIGGAAVTATVALYASFRYRPRHAGGPAVCRAAEPGQPARVGVIHHEPSDAEITASRAAHGFIPELADLEVGIEELERHANGERGERRADTGDWMSADARYELHRAMAAMDAECEAFMRDLADEYAAVSMATENQYEKGSS